MCGTCGCGDETGATMTDPASGATTMLRVGHGEAGHLHRHSDGTVHAHPHDHDHGHDHHHEHDHGHHHHHADPALVTLETSVLAANDRVAARNRGWFEGRGVVALNVMSSPGAGKTTLLERTIRALGQEIGIAVIEGDQMTTADAERVRAAGARAMQINTGAGCHLEADMVQRAVAELDPPAGSLLIIENVGNLVCPAMFDLGESAKVVVASVTEGEDKPLKYPFMFRAADVVLINKADLVPHVDFDEAVCRAHIAAINPSARVLTLSARTGDGMEAWYAWVRARCGAGRGQDKAAD